MKLTQVVYESEGKGPQEKDARNLSIIFDNWYNIMLEGTIESIAFGGSGVMRTPDGLVIFVPFAAPQDQLLITLKQKKKSHAFGQIVQIQQASPFRIAPLCPLFGTCGGCHLQHVSEEVQLEAKRRFVEDALKRIGALNFTVPPVIAAKQKWEYRRHIRLNTRPLEKGFEAGFIGADGTSFVPVPHCALFHSKETAILEEVHTLLRELSNEGVQEASIRIFKTEHEKFLLAFSSFPMLPRNYAKILEKRVFTYLQAVVLQSPSQKERYGEINTQVEVDALRIEYSPFGFLQNHPEQSLKLYHTIVDMAGPGSKKILDLYCGIGISSLLLAKQGHAVLGIEVHAESVVLAKKNAEVNQIPSARFIQAKAEDAASTHINAFKPDCIVLNPPRTGLDPALIHILIKSCVKELIYVSCMPSTLARDLKQLTAQNYEIEKIQPFDMFPQTTHVETVVKLRSI